MITVLVFDVDGHGDPPLFAALTVYNGWSGKMCGQGKHISIFILSVSGG